MASKKYGKKYGLSLTRREYDSLVLSTREMRPLNAQEQRDYDLYVKKHGEIPEEPLPAGASLTDPEIMRRAFASTFGRGKGLVDLAS